MAFEYHSQETNTIHSVVFASCCLTVGQVHTG